MIAGQGVPMRSRLSMLADPMIAVLIVATLAALVHPALGDIRASWQVVSNIAIFLLFLLNGMRVARGEIARAFANWRFFSMLFIWVFVVMPLVGLAMSKMAMGYLPALVALGFLYLGVLPSTVQSATSYTSLANGNIALSVVGAALINIVGVFVSAPLFALLGGGEVAELDSGVVLRIATILVLPFILGQALQGWTREWIQTRKGRIAWVDRLVIGIAVYVAFSGAVEQRLETMFDGRGWAVLVGLVVLYLAIAKLGAWVTVRVVGYSREDGIAFLFAAAQKSIAVGAPLAAILFRPEAAGFVIAPLLIYHLLQLVVAAPLASHLARNGP